MEFSDFLQQVRKASGYTQKDIAEILGVDRSTYAYYECGKTEPCIRSLKKLSALYGIPVDNLVNCRLEASPASLSAPLAEDGAFTNFEVFRKLDYTEQKLVLLYRSCRDKEAFLRHIRAYDDPDLDSFLNG